jgi:hypothetical protein
VGMRMTQHWWRRWATRMMPQTSPARCACADQSLEHAGGVQESAACPAITARGWVGGCLQAAAALLLEAEDSSSSSDAVLSGLLCTSAVGLVPGQPGAAAAVDAAAKLVLVSTVRPCTECQELGQQCQSHS